ncbi:putative F-box domain-containing protein [Helianthus anomalus]
MGTKKKRKDVELLPFSLIECDILPRVAAKSDIGRCRCVCKQWRSLLSTPTIGMMHLQLHGTTIDDYKLLVLDGATLRTLSPSTTTISCKPNPISSLDQRVFF